MDTSAPRTSRWLAHHGPDHVERCTVVAGRHVCRRCAVLYPVAAATAVVVALLVGVTPTWWTAAAIWLLPVPMVLDWTMEHLGLARWSPRRQVVVTAIGAPSLGLALLVHAGRPFAPVAVWPVLVWSGACLAVAVGGAGRRGPEHDWVERHDESERRRTERLAALAREL